MNIGQGKVFERPVGGSFLGTIIDVVDMPNYPTKFGPKDKVRVLWVLSNINGAPYLDSEGNPFTIAGFYNATQTDNSNLTKALRQILNAQPPLLSNSEDLTRLLLGRSNQLFLTQEPDQKNPQLLATFVAGIAPLPPGVVPPQAPVGFVRHKDKPPKQAQGQQAPGRPVTQYVAPQQSPLVQPNNVSFGQPATQKQESF